MYRNKNVYKAGKEVNSLKKGGPGGPARMRTRKFLRKKPVFSIRFTSFTRYCHDMNFRIKPGPPRFDKKVRGPTPLISLHKARAPSFGLFFARRSGKVGKQFISQLFFLFSNTIWVLTNCERKRPGPPHFKIANPERGGPALLEFAICSQLM